MKQHFLLLYLLIATNLVWGQDYSTYFIGNTSDIVTNPHGGICLMGGASENDHAMKWFLNRADHGDILVLRTSGSDGYNKYLFTELGIDVNSVETIVFNHSISDNDTYVVQKIEQAEAIWFAGGDQWSYIDYWRDTAIGDAINRAIKRNIVIGGISAGMAIQGQYYFSAQYGTVTSEVSLSNPYDNNVTIDSISFINNALLTNVITETHFDNPDRKGRLVSFLARIYRDFETSAYAIACDEHTAVCIDTSGVALVFGEYPEYDDNAYFIQPNCELPNQDPENCTPNNPLTWDLDKKVLSVYQIKGDSSGTKSFNLNNWQYGIGGTWHHWGVINGELFEESVSEINCSTSAIIQSTDKSTIRLFPNPVHNYLTVDINNRDLATVVIEMYNSLGEPQKINKDDFKSHGKLKLNHFRRWYLFHCH